MSDLHSANSEIRIGILGSGWMGSVHAECYRRIKGAKVVGTFRFRVLFERGAFELKTVFEGAGPPKNTFRFYSDEAQILTIEEHDPYEHELRHFVESIRGETAPGLLDAHHACEALKLSLATLKAVKEKREIRI